MPEQEDSLMKQIRTWVVNDYFTPNIRAEVILDMLLTDHVPQILRSQYKDIDAVFLTKEMSMIKTQEGKEPKNNRGPKIDYVLADKNRNRVYLVELKTTDSSIDTDQLSFYTSLADRTQNFGEVLGKRLLAILEKNFYIDLGDPDSWGDNTLEDAWNKIWEKRSQYEPRNKNPKESASYERMAMELIKAKGWAWRSSLCSRKYVYTLGRLMDYLHGKDGGRGLWNCQVELIYMIPEDYALFSPKIRSVAFVPYFEAEQKNNLLADIIKDIYGV